MTPDQDTPTRPSSAMVSTLIVHARPHGDNVHFEVIAADVGTAGPTILTSTQLSDVLHSIEAWVEEEFPPSP